MPEMTMPIPTAFHVMTKPIGPICNLDCKYCFYLEKERLYPGEHKWKMGGEVLERYVRQYIEQQQARRIDFAWQGGEPTLLGVDYFRTVVELQRKYGEGREIHNALQTNGTLLDDQWGAFLAEHRFLVGVSIDGPRHLHDHYRVDKKQAGTYDEVMRGINVLKRHQVEFNTLSVVNHANSHHPLEVYRFLCEIGSGFIQFIPLVERLASARLKAEGLDLAGPPQTGAGPDDNCPVTPWSVEAGQYGRFLCDIFDQWVRRDVGRVFVQLFDVALGNWMGLGSSLCLFGETCGNALAIEHNGDFYSCDHYVYPPYRLGNIMNRSLGEMVQSEQQRKFGRDKRDTLPKYCRQCEVRFACNGECPKHRFIKTPDGEEGLNYLCPAYKAFFNHIDPYMKTMVRLLNARQPAAAIMPMLEAQRRSINARATAGRNDMCPCGSGRKFKKCCGRGM